LDSWARQDTSDQTICASISIYTCVIISISTIVFDGSYNLVILLSGYSVATGIQAVLSSGQSSLALTIISVDVLCLSISSIWAYTSCELLVVALEVRSAQIQWLVYCLGYSIDSLLDWDKSSIEWISVVESIGLSCTLVLDHSSLAASGLVSLTLSCLGVVPLVSTCQLVGDDSLTANVSSGTGVVVYKGSTPDRSDVVGISCVTAWVEALSRYLGLTALSVGIVILSLVARLDSWCRRVDALEE
jgi:hypothetical protein